jgi:DNA repair exonuclease SbcCD ATPase subunit
MKIGIVTIKNYGSFYGEHSFDFSNRGLELILGENQDAPRANSNGSGKSTLPDALDWCLYGVTPRDDHADSVVNDGQTVAQSEAV